MAVIKDNPGIESFQIAAKCAYSMAHTKNVLGVISGHSMAFPIPRGTKRAWYEAEKARPLLENWEKTRRKRRNPKDPKPVTQRQKIEELAKNSEGASSASIIKELGISLNALVKHCGSLVKQGRLFRAEREGCRIRWFDTQARADAWVGLGPKVPSEWVVPKAHRNNEPTIRARILELAGQQYGVTKAVIQAEFPAMPIKNITRHISHLVSKRKVFRADRPGCFTRWCATQADAKAWSDLPPTSQQQQEERARLQRLQEREDAKRASKEAEQARKKAEKARQAMKNIAEKRLILALKKEKAVPAPVVIGKPAAPKEVDYSRAKITVCPSPGYDSRYQLPPGARIVGEFSREWQQRRGVL